MKKPVWETCCRFFRTIRGLIFLLLVLLIIPILCVQFLIYYDSLENRRISESQSNLEIARAVSAFFHQFIQDQLKYAHGIGRLLALSGEFSLEGLSDFLTGFREVEIPL